jgi:adhesin transport system outer membrane protein
MRGLVSVFKKYHLDTLFFVSCVIASLSYSIETAQSQSLKDVIEYTLNNYPSIAQAEANATSVTADLERARSAYWPTLGVEVYTQNDYVRYGSGYHVPVYGVGPVAKMPIYTFGRLEAEVNRQGALKDEAVEKIKTAKDDAVMAAVENYIGWARSLELVAISSENLAGHEQIAGDTEKIVASDPGRRFDLIQAQTRVEGARLLVSQRQAELQQNISRLARYWPQPMPAVKAANPVGLDEFKNAMPSNIDVAFSDVEKSHPYLMQLRSRIMAAEASLANAKAQLMPSISVQVSSVNNGTAQLLLNAPLFDRTATSGSIDAATANLNATKMAFDEGRLITREKMLISFVDHKSASERLAVSAQQSKRGKELLTAYREQFLAGRRSLIEVLNAQNEYFGYRMTTATSVFDIKLARFRLMAAMGRLATGYLPK